MNAPANIPDKFGGDLDAAAAVMSEFIALLEWLNALDEPQRSAELVAWCRSGDHGGYMSVGMLLEGWQGALHREAWRKLDELRRADLPGNLWQAARWERGRTGIARQLGIEGELHAGFASWPFRAISTAEDEHWIAAAVPPPRIWSAGDDLYEHLDIETVILWNPRLNRTQLAGDAPRESAVVLPPCGCMGPLKVYADTGAFFRDWARCRMTRRQIWSDAKTMEVRDGCQPGALIIGPVEKARFPLNAAGELEPAAGMTAKSLQSLVLRSAHLPKVVSPRRKEGAGARV